VTDGTGACGAVVGAVATQCSVPHTNGLLPSYQARGCNCAPLKCRIYGAGIVSCLDT
jgi:hypothetical protein